jgi:hypothetical protein
MRKVLKVAAVILLLALCVAPECIMDEFGPMAFAGAGLLGVLAWG